MRSGRGRRVIMDKTGLVRTATDAGVGGGGAAAADHVHLVATGPAGRDAAEVWNDFYGCGGVPGGGAAVRLTVMLGGIGSDCGCGRPSPRRRRTVGAGTGGREVPRDRRRREVCARRAERGRSKFFDRMETRRSSADPPTVTAHQSGSGDRVRGRAGRIHGRGRRDDWYSGGSSPPT